MGISNASRTAVEQWWDTSKAFCGLKETLNTLAQYHVKKTSAEHREQPGAAGRIIQDLETGMRGKVNFGNVNTNAFKTLVANLPEALQRNITPDGIERDRKSW